MDKILGAFIFLKERWEEPSTHAALSAICTAVGTSVNTGLIDSIFTLLAIAFGVIGFWKKEAKPLTEIK